MKISIVIATFNAAKTLNTCLDSIVPQLNEEVELIIIDGGSSDGTNEIIAAYGDKVSYTKSERDKGIYDAWNKGVLVANGEWIAFIGADDILLPNALSAYLECINNIKDIEKYDYICAHNEFIDENGKVLKILGAEPKWSSMKRMMPAAHVASLHSKKNLFQTLGGYNLDFKICADYEMLMRKKADLRYIFMDRTIARMKVGGMSFSINALKEVYKIRRLHQSVSPFANILLFLINVFAFKLFIIRNRLKGKQV